MRDPDDEYDYRYKDGLHVVYDQEYSRWPAAKYIVISALLLISIAGAYILCK